MNGFGRGSGMGRGRTGRGAGWGRGAGFAPSLPGYDYVHNCRCGFGPNAYYRNAAGQILPASGLYSGANQPQPARPSSEIEQLKAENTDLERRLRDLETRFQVTT